MTVDAKVLEPIFKEIDQNLRHLPENVHQGEWKELYSRIENELRKLDLTNEQLESVPDAIREEFPSPSVWDKIWEICGVVQNNVVPKLRK